MQLQMSPPPLSERSDGALFALVGAGHVDARAAQQILYERHVQFLFGALSRQRDKLLRLAGLSAEDVVQDTFERAFQRAHTFRDEPTLDADRQRRRARAWLGRIAQNLVADAFRRFREVSASDVLDRYEVPAMEEEPASRPELRPVRRALETLTEREQDVLRVTALYHKLEGGGRLPNAVSAELGRRWGISNENVRAIRSRAMKKLREAIVREQQRETGR